VGTAEKVFEVFNYVISVVKDQIHDQTNKSIMMAETYISMVWGLRLLMLFHC